MAQTSEDAKTSKASGLIFTALCGVSLVAWFRPLLDTLGLASRDDRYTHIILILPLAIALIVQATKESARKDCPHNFQIYAPAAAGLIAALAIAAIARWERLAPSSNLDLTIQMLALVTWWVASVAFCFGLPTVRSLAFPLLFLFCMVPIPTILLDPIVAGLQHGSTLAAQFLFWVCRVPVLRQGTTLFIPYLDIDVTVECSSIRSSLMLLIVSLVAAHLLLKTFWRKALLIALVIPFSVAKNGLRIFTIGILGSRVDPGFLTGHLHRQGGIIFFLIAMAVIFAFLWMMRRSERSVPA